MEAAGCRNTPCSYGHSQEKAHPIALTWNESSGQLWQPILGQGLLLHSCAYLQFAHWPAKATSRHSFFTSSYLNEKEPGLIWRQSTSILWNRKHWCSKKSLKVRLRLGEVKNIPVEGNPTAFQSPFFTKSYNFPHLIGSKCLDHHDEMILAKTELHQDESYHLPSEILASNLQWTGTHPVFYRLLEGERGALKCWLLFSITL